MKLIIAGSRTLSPHRGLITEALISFGHQPLGVTEVVSGGARGVDASGESWAKVFARPIRYFLPDWSAHGKKSAGPIRNAEMAEYADALLLIWNGQSKGSANMKQQMERRKKPVYEVILRGPKP